MDQVPSGPYIGKRKVEPEPVVLTTRKHLFGLVVLYVQALLGMTVAVLLVTFVLPSLLEVDDPSTIYAYGAAGLLFLGVIVAVLLLVATFVYRQSQLVVTTKNLTEVNQIGIFNRKISQLSLEDVEDVSAEQKGLLATMFNYGTLFVETAGEQSNFHFNYCPRPNEIAHQVSIVEQQFNKDGNNQGP